MNRQTQRYQDQAPYQIQFDQTYLRDSFIKDDNSFRSFENQSQNLQDNVNEKRGKKSLQTNQISLLNDKKRSLQNFMDTIGDYSSQPIRQDILQHCQKVSIRIPSNITKASVMKLVKNRVDKMIKNKRIKKNWSEEDINILIWVISKYCQFYGITNPRNQITQADWTNIAGLIPGVTGKSCMFKWLSLKKSNLAENSWLEEQSLLLDQMVKKYGQQNWCRISQQLYLNNPQVNKVYRCPKQCREHWNCYLNPKLKKGPWQKKQDYLLLRAVKELQGVKKWAQIVKMFNGRTENALKNRFTLIIEKQQKQLRNKKKLTQLQLVEHFLKKHESQAQIDEGKLKFLSQKRQLINENQLKRKPKKTRVKKIKEDQSYYSQQQQYVPEQPLIKTEKRSCRHKPKSSKERGRQKEREFQIQLEMQQQEQRKVVQIRRESYEREQSFNRQISIKKQDDIFEQDDQINSENDKREQHMLQEQQNAQQDIQEQMEGMEQQKNAGNVKVEGRLQAPKLLRNSFSQNEEHTKQQNILIQSILPFTSEIMQSYVLNNSLIPIKITQLTSSFYQVVRFNN